MKKLEFWVQQSEINCRGESVIKSSDNLNGFGIQLKCGVWRSESMKRGSHGATVSQIPRTDCNNSIFRRTHLDVSWRNNKSPEGDDLSKLLSICYQATYFNPNHVFSPRNLNKSFCCLNLTKLRP